MYGRVCWSLYLNGSGTRRLLTALFSHLTQVPLVLRDRTRACGWSPGPAHLTPPPPHSPCEHKPVHARASQEEPLSPAEPRPCLEAPRSDGACCFVFHLVEEGDRGQRLCLSLALAPPSLCFLVGKAVKLPPAPKAFSGWNEATDGRGLCEMYRALGYNGHC